MMGIDSAHRSRWAISEVVFGIPFLISLALQRIVSLSLPPGVLRLALIPVGAILIILGIGLVVLARRELRHYDQPTDLGHPTSKIVQSDVFSISRNPLYLGIVSALSGMVLVFNNLWILVLLISAMVLCHYVLIAPEERYLHNKIGNEYLFGC